MFRSASFRTSAFLAGVFVFGSVQGQDHTKPVQKEEHQISLPQDDFVRMTFIAFSQDGKKVLAIQGKIVTWIDWSTGRVVGTFRHEALVECAAISGDGNWLAIGSGDKSVCVWEVTTEKCIRTLDKHPGKVYRVQLSADGKWLACCCLDGKVPIGGDVVLWEIASGRLIPKPELDNGDRERLGGALTVNDGKTLITVVPGKNSLWDIKSGKQLLLFKGLFGGVSADGKSLLTFNGTSNKHLREIFLTRVWDVETGNEKQTVFGSDERPWSGLDTSIFSPDGKQIVVVIDEHTIDKHTGDRLETIRFWEAATGKETRVLKVYGAQASELFMSNDSKLLCWRSRVGSHWEREKVIIMDVNTGKELSVLKGK